MAKYQEILDELKELRGDFNHLAGNLYDSNGHEGDIPEIKRLCKGFTDHLENHSRRLVEGEGERKRIEQKVDERTIAKLGRKTMWGISGGGILLLVTLIFTALQLFT